jgi:hypothetical protein
MRFSTARSLALATLVPALALFVFVPGCAKQSEGERCGDNTYGVDSEDCADGLTCVVKDTLLNDATHRCCYADLRVSDSRCEPKGFEPGPVGGAGGGGGGGGTAGGGSSGSGVAGGSVEAGVGGEGG